MKKRRFLLVFLLLIIAATSAGAFWIARNRPRAMLIQGILQKETEQTFPFLEHQVTRVEIKNPIAAKIVKAAHAQEGDAYNATYKQLSYPGGDVPQGAGACTDVIVRAFRAAGFDLQKLIHEDMKAHFGKYPDPWGLGHTDKNIDHRRVPNQMRFFERFGQTLTTEVSNRTLKEWQPGDVVVWKMDDGKWHIGLLSDGLGEGNVPLVIHNAWECVEQDYLTRWKIVGHFRYPR